MSTPVVMPQMGESIAEGTIVRWIKKVGDSVDRDEPLFEISTDKVDAEIPSPAAGMLLEIAVKEGETVPVNSVVATIGAAGEKRGAAGAAAAAGAAPPPQRRTRRRRDAAAAGQPDAAGWPRRRDAPTRPPPSTAPTTAAPQRSSPLVRRIAKEHGVDIGRISGTGIGGRVTKQDILELPRQGSVDLRRAGRQPAATAARPAAPTPARGPAFKPGERVEIAADVGDAQEDRRAHGAQQAHLGARLLGLRGQLHARRRDPQGAARPSTSAQGVKLTFTSFIAKAAVDCLRRHPVINASIDGDNIVYKQRRSTSASPWRSTTG